MRTAIVSPVALSLAAIGLGLWVQPARASVDKSFDWPGNKRVLKVKVEAADTEKLLGDTKLNDAIAMAIAQLNMDKADTMWEWMQDNNAASPDIVIKINNNPPSPNGGAGTGGFGNKDKDGKLKGPLTIEFDQSPQRGSKANPINEQWGTAGKKYDPISVAMHELLHTARSDHMPNMAGKTSGAADYFNPIAPGEKHTDRKLSAEDKALLKMASTMVDAKVDKKNYDSTMGGDTFGTDEAGLSVAPTALIGLGEVSLQHLTHITVPAVHELQDGVGGLLGDRRIIWGAQVVFDNTLALGPGPLQFQMIYPEFVLQDFLLGDILDEAAMRPYAYSPLLDEWVPLASGEVDAMTNTGFTNLLGTEAAAFLEIDPTAGTSSLIVGIGGPAFFVPEPAGIALSTLAVLWTIGIARSMRGAQGRLE